MQDEPYPSELDGWALWQEHKPQSAEDWIAVAQRSIDAEDYDPSVGSPLFQALYATFKVKRETQTRERELWSLVLALKNRILEADSEPKGA